MHIDASGQFGQDNSGQVHGEWLVLTVQHQRAAVAVQNLIRQGFHVYCPMLVKRIRHARRAYDAPRPMFPGYLFIDRLRSPERWRPILGTFGVKSLIMCGESPALLPGGFVERLKAHEVDGVICKPETPFRVGQNVAIRGGAFDGLIGTICDLKENRRVLILIDLLNQPTRVHVKAVQLVPAPASS